MLRPDRRVLTSCMHEEGTKKKGHVLRFTESFPFISTIHGPGSRKRQQGMVGNKPSGMAQAQQQNGGLWLLVEDIMRTEAHASHTGLACTPTRVSLHATASDRVP